MAGKSWKEWLLEELRGGDRSKGPRMREFGFVKEHMGKGEKAAREHVRKRKRAIRENSKMMRGKPKSNKMSISQMLKHHFGAE